MALHKVEKVAMIIAGVAATAFGVYNYLAHEPDVHLHVMSIERTFGYDVQSIETKLKDVEGNYGSVTGDRTLRLMARWQAIMNDSAQSTAVIQNFGKQVQGQIEFYENRANYVNDWVSDDIQYKNGVVIWPDSVRVNLLDPIESDWLFSYSFLDSVRSARVLDTALLEKIRAKAHGKYKGLQLGDTTAGLEVSTRLRLVREEIRTLGNSDHRVLRLRVFVENQSWSRNMIIQEGVLRLYIKPLGDEHRHCHNSLTTDCYFQVEMSSEEPVSCDAMSGHEMIFNSRFFADLNESGVPTDEILKAFDQNEPYLFFVQDIKDNVWTTGGVMSTPQTNSIEQMLGEMDRKCEKVLLRVISDNS